MDRSEHPRRQLLNRRHRVHTRAARKLLARGIAVALVALTACGGSSPDLAQLTWLEGCWDSVSPQRTVSECWLPDGDALRGQGRIDDTVYENTVIGLTERGPEYIVTRTNGDITHFAVTRATSLEARFENPEHDNPKWLQYTRVGEEFVASFGIGPTADEEWRFVKR